jgi:hypothetical protein
MDWSETIWTHLFEDVDNNFSSTATTMSYWAGALCGFAVFELYYFFRGLTTFFLSHLRGQIDLLDESVHYGKTTFKDQLLYDKSKT